MQNKRAGKPRPKSGIFEVQGSTIQRRTSKRASSNDRHGHVYPDDFVQNPLLVSRGAETFDRPVSGRLGGTSNQEIQESEDEQRGHDSGSHGREISGKLTREALVRPRTRTLEERVRGRSSPDLVPRRTARQGSVQIPASSPLGDEDSSIGFPSVIPPSPVTNRSRQRLVKTPSRPGSPALNQAQMTSRVPPPLPTNEALTEADRILQLMKTTCGRMHGILSFRTTRTGPWSSGYCIINVASGSLIYQMKGDTSLAKTQTLVPDLRGCRVRTQTDNDSEGRTPILEISTHSSGLDVHLRPHVTETFDSWLAALLCWQPLRSRGAQNKMPLPHTSSTTERKQGDRRRQSPAKLDKDAAIIKFGRVLWWDPVARVDAPRTPSKRISTYKQQRMASGTPWRKASCKLQEDGYIEIFLDTDSSLVAAAHLSALAEHAVQRLHPSALDDEYCVAIYPQYTALGDPPDDRQPIYISLESRDIFEVWFVLLRSFTVLEMYGPGQAMYHPLDLANDVKEDGPKKSEDMFRMERHFSLRIIEAKIQPPRTDVDAYENQANVPRSRDEAIGEYCAEVQLDGEVRGCTAYKARTRNPFWREDWEFLDLPPVLSNVSVALKQRTVGPRDWTLVADGQYADVDNLGLIGDVHISPLDVVVGTVNLQFDDFQRGRDVERWFKIHNEHGRVVGQFLMRVRIDETIVLMSEAYKELADLLHAFANGLTQEIAAQCSDYQKLQEVLVNIYQVTGSTAEWIMSLVEDEIDNLRRRMPSNKYRFSRRIASNDSFDQGVDRELLVRDLGKSATTEANLLFRGNSLLTKALDFHMRRLGREYLEEMFIEQLRDIDESEPECEVDPNRVRNPHDLQRNWKNLKALTENMWRSIADSASKCPPELRLIFRRIRECAEDRYGDFLRTVGYSSVSGFLFLRLLCPAVLNPKLFGLLKDHPRPRAQRTLTLIAKSLQTLANLTMFGSKESWMEPMNGFLKDHRQEFKDFIDSICSISHNREQPAVPGSYTTPLALYNRLPLLSREGFPSLPYLIDQPKELAVLVRVWAESKTRVYDNDGGETNETVARFDDLCTQIRLQTRNVLNAAEQAERPSGALAIKWEALVAQMDGKLHAEQENDNDGEHSASAQQQPAAHRRFLARPVPLSRNDSSFSATSHDGSLLPHHPPSPALPSPVLDSSSSAVSTELTPPGSSSGMWDPGTDAGTTDNSNKNSNNNNSHDDNDTDDSAPPPLPQRPGAAARRSSASQNTMRAPSRRPPDKCLEERRASDRGDRDRDMDGRDRAGTLTARSRLTDVLPFRRNKEKERKESAAGAKGKKEKERARERRGTGEDE